MPFSKDYQESKIKAANAQLNSAFEKLRNSGFSAHVDGISAYANKGFVLEVRKIGNVDEDVPFGVNFFASVESFSDSYACNFNQETAFGRTDPIPSYQNTTRSISMQFVLVADNLLMGVKNLGDVKTLVHMLYPEYTKHGDQNVFSKAPVVSMRWANLVNELGDFLPGIISNFNFTPDVEAGYFEYGPNGNPSLPASFQQPYDVDVVGERYGLVPKVIRVSIDFNPVHQETLGFTEQGLKLPTSGFLTEFPYGTPQLGLKGKAASVGLPNYLNYDADPPFIKNLETESFRGQNFDNLSDEDKERVMASTAGSLTNKYAQEIEKRRAEILKQSNETSNPWVKLKNKFS